MEKQGKISIHRALAELKVLDSRIQKKIIGLDLVGGAQKDGKVNNHLDREDYKKAAKSDYQGVIDLIKRRERVKSAVVKSNAETKVIINGSEMTVAEAIDKKATIKLQKSLLKTLRQQKSDTISELDKVNTKVEGDAKTLAETAVGRDGVNTRKDDYEAVYDPYIARNKFEFIDPIGISKKIEGLDEEISSFELEIDAKLSEINATTFIEVD